MLDSFYSIFQYVLLLIYLTIEELHFVMKLLESSWLRLKATHYKGERRHFLKVLHAASCLGIDGRVGARGLNLHV